MSSLVTLTEVQDRLRIDGDDNDLDLMRMAEEATDIVLNYLKRPSQQGDGYDEWTPETVPGTVRSAILLVVRNLHDELDEPLSQAVKNLVERYRDPALA